MISGTQPGVPSSLHNSGGALLHRQAGTARQIVHCILVLNASPTVQRVLHRQAGTAHQIVQCTLVLNTGQTVQ